MSDTPGITEAPSVTPTQAESIVTETPADAPIGERNIFPFVYAGIGVLVLVAIAVIAVVVGRESGPPTAAAVTPEATPATTTAAPEPTPPPIPRVLPDVTISGGPGAKVIPLDPGPGIARIMTINYQQTEEYGSFNAVPIEANGSEGPPLTYADRSFTGSALINVARALTGVRIQADGNWAVTIMDAQKAAVFPGQMSGTGPTALQVPQDSVLRTGIHTMTVNYTPVGEYDTVYVWMYDADGKPVGDTMVAGEFVARPGTKYIMVDARGDWTLSVS